MINNFNCLLLMAIAFAFSTCALDNNKAEEHNLTGINHINHERYAEAIKEYQIAYELSNNKASKVVYLRNIANAFHDIEQMDSSKYYLIQARDLSKPRSFEFHLNQGDIYVLEGKIKEGIKELKRAENLRPGSIDVNNVLALIYTGRYGEEHTNYEKALNYNLAAYEFNKDDIIIKKELARNYYALNDFKNAEILFNEIFNFDSSNLVNQFNLAITKYYLDENEMAKDMFQKIKEVDPSVLEGYEDIMADLEVQ